MLFAFLKLMTLIPSAMGVTDDVDAIAYKASRDESWFWIVVAVVRNCGCGFPRKIDD
jgi:hypothetical protein